MQLDVGHVNGLVDARHLEELLGELAKRGVLPDAPLVALEVHHIHLHRTGRALRQRDGCSSRLHARHRSARLSCMQSAVEL